MKSLEEIHPYISIHALLAESDAHQNRINKSLPYFYPRSPCGERQCWKRHKCRKSQKFLSTLSLRRATDKVLEAVSRNGISIHALLAESDNGRKSLNALAEYFYPRSPCGERPNFHRVRYNTVDISIHALLAESDDTDWEIVNVPKISIHALLAESDRHLSQLIPLHSYFYPRSPCGERLAEVDGEDTSSGDFYPRSPCGERPTITGIIYSDRKISIHALLAESDDLHRGEMVLTARISIHALLAESDRATSFAVSVAENFYPRSPCGERPEADGIVDVIGEFLSTLSLRRATLRKFRWVLLVGNFYPRSPCGERLISLL